MPARHLAAILRTEGEPLAIGEAETPSPRPGEAIVRLHAAALNHRDLWMRKGAYGKMAGLPCTLGSDGCGVVESVGSAADESWSGRTVVINPSLDWGDDDAAPGAAWRILGVPDDGTFAQRVRVATAQLFDAPAGWSAEESAALPLAGVTAYRSLFTRGGLKAGQRVLLPGIGGGVAQWALRFARAAGAEIWVTSGSEAKLAAAKTTGAAGGILHSEPGWGAHLLSEAGPFDLCVDSAGGAVWTEACEALRPGGRLVFFGATLGAGKIPMRKAFFKQISILGTSMGSPRDFAAMLAFVAAHDLRPPVDRVYDLAEIEAALAHMEAGAQSGKIVLRIP